MFLFARRFYPQFKAELIEQGSNTISQRAVGRILQGLEGAVITSIKEVNEHVNVTSSGSAAPRADKAQDSSKSARTWTFFIISFEVEKGQNKKRITV